MAIERLGQHGEPAAVAHGRQRQRRPQRAGRGSRLRIRGQRRDARAAAIRRRGGATRPRPSRRARRRESSAAARQRRRRRGLRGQADQQRRRLAPLCEGTRPLVSSAASSGAAPRSPSRPRSIALRNGRAGGRRLPAATRERRLERRCASSQSSSSPCKVGDPRRALLGEVAALVGIGSPGRRWRRGRAACRRSASRRRATPSACPPAPRTRAAGGRRARAASPARGRDRCRAPAPAAGCRAAPSTVGSRSTSCTGPSTACGGTPGLETTSGTRTCSS